MADRVPLEYPLYGATFGEAVRRLWAKWRTYSGRASRSEFWFAYLFTVLVSTGLGLVIGVVAVVAAFALILPVVGSDGRASPALTGPMVGLILLFYVLIFAVQLPLIVPLVAAIVRRLHDAGFSGTLALLLLVPLGGYVVLVLCILESRPEGMRFDPPLQPVYGSDPDPSATIRS